jgi:hypothetical protein
VQNQSSSVILRIVYKSPRDNLLHINLLAMHKVRKKITRIIIVYKLQYRYLQASRKPSKERIVYNQTHLCKTTSKQAINQSLCLSAHSICLSITNISSHENIVMASSRCQKCERELQHIFMSENILPTW